MSVESVVSLLRIVGIVLLVIGIIGYCIGKVIVWRQDNDGRRK